MLSPLHKRIRLFTAFLFVVAAVEPVRATWSIVIANTKTMEVAVGTVTCLENLNLLSIVPVVVVAKGAAAVQAAGDFDGIRRPVIFDALMAGTDPNVILQTLSAFSNHEFRQYGIVDTQGRVVTFTGTQNGIWAGGLTETIGDLVFAVQGNVLAGDCVVPAIRQAIVTTQGDIPEKLMAGMRAAQANGGDGRCSCSAGFPPGCGCPPPPFDKAGHIGGMVVARVGDIDDPLCNAGGCVSGDYFMKINVAFQTTADADPVDQLQTLFDAWRANLVGRPDAVQSLVTYDPDSVPADGVSTTTMQIDLRDASGSPITVSIPSLTVEHSPASAALTAIGPVVDNGGGLFTVVLTAGTSPGVDRFRVVLSDGVRPVTLTPDPALTVSRVVPAVSTWGLAVMVLLLAISATVMIRQKPATAE